MRRNPRAWLLFSPLLALGCTVTAPESENAPPSAENAAETATTAAGAATATSAALAPTEATETGPRKRGPGPHYVAASVRTTLEAALVEIEGPELGQQLTQIAKRVLVWWLDVRREVWRDDRIELVYELREGEEPIVHAIWYRSNKLGSTKSAIRYRADGAQFARMYEPDGHEVELRLKDSPIESYEQVTSLLRDGRGHRGVDFKAPVGTPIYAPFSGRVLRRNWATRRNGNCVEIIDSKTGIKAYFLHLHTIDPAIRPGRRVKKGQKLATAGNTGRSSAPHLHYQLDKGGRVRDPFQVHSTWRAKLPTEQAAKAKAQLDRYAELRAESS